MASKETELIWKNQSERMRNSFKTMLLNGDFIDVTLWCEKRSIGAHKCILAAASDYFREIFKEVASDRPAIVFKNMQYDDLLAVISYVYNGRVVVKNGSLGSFGKVAKMLEIVVDELVMPAIQTAPATSIAAVPEVNGRHMDSGVNSGESSPPEPQKSSVYRGGQQDPTIEAIKSSPSCSSHQSSTTSKAKRPIQTFDEHVQLILRDMRIDSVDAAVRKLLKHENVYTIERATIVIDMAIDRAIHFFRFATVYVTFCKRIIDRESEFTNDFSFKKLLLNRCHSIFTDLVIANESTINAKHRLKCLGITRFIGCMYMHKILFANIIEWVIGILIDFATEDKLEYLYELLAIVGKRIELQSGDYDTDIQWYRNLDEHYKTLSQIAKDTDHEMKIDTRSRLNDLVQNRQAGWKSPINLLLGDYGPVVNQKLKQEVVDDNIIGLVNGLQVTQVGPIEQSSVNGHENLVSGQWDNQTDETAEVSNLDTSGTVQTIIESLRSFIREKNNEASTAAQAATAVPVEGKVSKNRRKKNRKTAAASNNINAENNSDTK